MAINEEGELWVWGNNRFGQLACVNEFEDVMQPLKLKTQLRFCTMRGRF